MSTEVVHPELIITEQNERVVVGRLNRPKVNAYNPALETALEEFIDEVDADDTVRAAVLGSAIPGVFSAGADVRWMAEQEATPEVKDRFCRKIQNILNKFGTTDKPIIAAIDGFCMGGGAEIAVACDFRFATNSSTFGYPEIDLAVIPGSGGTGRSPRLIGIQRTLWMMATGETIDAQTALAWGLVDKIFPTREEMEQKALNFAQKLAGKAPIALAAIKHLVRNALNVSLSEALEREIERQQRCFRSQDGKDGIRAYAEKRKEKPVFTGK